MLFQEYLKKEIFEIVIKLLEKMNLESDFLDKHFFNVEISQKQNFGDLSSNVALVFSKFFKISPEKLAELISIELRKDKYVLKVEVIKPGFINIFFSNLFWQNQLSQFIKLDGSYNYNLKTKSICIEFVSANPTGLMHIGHARGAVLGDAISSVLQEVGHNITKEYYINDAGEQIKKLNKTILFHVENFLEDSESPLPDDLYPGEYLKNIGNYFDKNFKSLSSDLNLNFENNGLISVPIISFNSRSKSLDLQIKTFLTQEMLKRGYIFSNAIYLSYKHNKKNIDRFFDNFYEILKKNHKNFSPEFFKKKLDGPVCHSGFKRLT